MRRGEGKEVEETDLELDEVERESFENWLERGRVWARLEVVRGVLWRGLGEGWGGEGG